MKKIRTNLLLDQLQLNEGQLDWLGRNPRYGSKEDIDKCVESLREDPDWLEDKPLSVVAAREKDQYVVFIGNLRTVSAPLAGLQEVPAIIYVPEKTPDPEAGGKLTYRIDRATVARRALKDNGTFGHWNYDELPNWGVSAEQLGKWGVDCPDWYKQNDAAQRKMEAGGLSSDGMESGEGYDEFVDKFKQKLTTDDCYTPPVVYDIVCDFVNNHIVPLNEKKIVRPFFPGGDYENLKQYPSGCVVIDNPPFSIYAKVVRFYVENAIPFFLFGPNLTLFTSNTDVCYVVANVPIVYENGAVVSTGFVTNMVPEIRIWVDHTIREKVIEAQKTANEQGKYNLPENVVTSARLGKIAARGIELKIKGSECLYIHDLDAMKEIGRGLYGGGFLLAAAAAAAAAAAEKEAYTIKLSERELALVASLDEQNHD